MLEMKNVYKSYAKQGKRFRRDRLEVLAGVTFSLQSGECVGLVGESGSGKSTLTRLIVGLDKEDKGSIEIEGKRVRDWIKQNKGKMSIVFQDYTSSANPRLRVKEIIAELMQAIGWDGSIEERVKELLEMVELPQSMLERYPHELSGGQLQRVCIARAISTAPKLLILDEAISSLDASTQVQILELLLKLKQTMNITILFISHDIQAITYLCNQILFLHKGQIIEHLTTPNLKNAKHDYTRALLGTGPDGITR